MTSNRDNLLVAHREFVREVRSLNTTETVVSDLITPSNVSLFPWLSTIARNYELFRFKRLRFEYVTRCPTTLSGSIVYAVDFDPTDDVPYDLPTLCQMAGARSSSLWLDCSLAITGKDLHPSERMYISNSPGVPNRKTDLGRLIQRIDATSSAQTVGFLWVSYQIELIKPQPASALSGMKLTHSSVAGPTLLPEGEYYSGGGLPIYQNNTGVPGGDNKLIFKGNFEGLLILNFTTNDNYGHTSAGLIRPMEVLVEGKFDAVRWLGSYTDWSGNSTVPEGYHSVALFLIKTGALGRDSSLIFHVDRDVNGQNLMTQVKHVATSFIPSDIQILDRVLPKSKVDGPGHDYVTWRIPTLGANLPHVPLPPSPDYPPS